MWLLEIKKDKLIKKIMVAKIYRVLETEPLAKTFT